MELSQSGQEGRFFGYVSPWRALAWSFHRSRENWRRKYAAVKADAKQSQNEVRDLRKSRAGWKQKAEALEAEKQVAANDDGGAASELGRAGIGLQEIQRAELSVRLPPWRRGIRGFGPQAARWRGGSFGASQGGRILDRAAL